MKPKDLSELSLDEIMERIRTELAEQQKTDLNKLSATESAGITPSITPSGEDSPRVSLDLSRDCGRLENKDEYLLEDFLQFHDQDFIRMAYQHILGRKPDPNGYTHYLNCLRSGRYSKTEILGRLRYSAEGRMRQITVRHLLIPFMLKSLFNVPVVGYVARVLVGILNLPAIIRNIQKNENAIQIRIGEQQYDNKKALEQLESALNTLIENNRTNQENGDAAIRDIREKLSLIQENLALKADKNAIEKLLKGKVDQHILQEIMTSKADKEVVQAALESKVDKDVLHDVMTSKADKDELRDILRQIIDHKRHILDQDRRLSLLIGEVKKRMPEPLTKAQIEAIVAEEDHLMDAMYLSFEDQFRGTKEDIKERQKVYLPWIEQAGAGTAEKPIIDIGCGRGEWLELLKENGYTAQGVDINRIMISECYGLEIKESDGLAYIEKLKNNSVGFITAFHLVEHLPFKTLIHFIDECFRVLCPGGGIIFETPNPENLKVGACNFYMDPTHIKPIPAQLLKYLTESRGFSKPSIHYLHPATEYILEETHTDVSLLLFGPRDYALIANKV